jgi:hypothetical protein
MITVRLLVTGERCQLFGVNEGERWKVRCAPACKGDQFYNAPDSFPDYRLLAPLSNANLNAVNS